MNSLPIDAVLGDILAALEAAPRLVLAAPPGAGKTTRVPLALLSHFDPPGRIILIEPRRIAARMAAERLASQCGPGLGKTVGLSTRIERRVSAATRIEVVTDGLFPRRLLADPTLPDVSMVLFDEFHERALSADLGLALALETQAVFRNDLKLVIMSATLDTGRVAGAINAPVLTAQGRAFPVETRYLGRDDTPPDAQMTRAVRRALRETDGCILAFLPGAREIQRTAGLLAEDSPPDVDIAPLYGALSPAEQDAAVRPAPNGRRKVVLATDIAESALTIEGITTVIDSGLARRPEGGTEGAERLVTVRASLASVDQRRGRAGRLGPGLCYRLWAEQETRGLPPHDTPEILRSDLSGLVLTLADWGEREPSRLTWVDPPPPGRVAQAREALVALGALGPDGSLTDTGRRLAALPLSPRLAALVARAGTAGGRQEAAAIAALISERGLGGPSSDLARRLAVFAADRSPRARQLRRQAERWANSAGPVTGGPSPGPGPLIAAAWPDRIARRDPSAPGRFLMASGSAARLPEDDPLAGSAWLAIAEATGAGPTPLVRLAAPLAEAEILRLARPETVEAVTFDTTSQRFRGRREKRIGAIVLSGQPLPKPSGDAARAALAAALEAGGFAAIGADEAVDRLLARIALLKEAGLGEDWPDWTAQALAASAADWLLAAVPGGTVPGPDRVVDALLARLDWPLPQTLAEGAPLSWMLPSGRAAPLDYLDDNAPLIEARVQEVFGLTAQPAIAAGRVPLALVLLSPARRPVAVTRDLAGFWAGGYRDMAKDMRARYPKHDWPDAPANARPHEGRTRARL